MVTTQNQTILIVDDEPLNLKVLHAHLAGHGYAVVEAQSGLEALEKARANPDLILLDIMMPEMDGIETCRLLKQNEATRDIPVIFLSALQDTRTKVFGLEKGGVDYVSKPFDTRELLARIKIHLTIRRQEVQIKDYTTRLEHMVEERTRQLIHADRLATLGTFAAAIAHEINNPTSYVSGNIEFLKEFWKSAKPVLAMHAHEEQTGRVLRTIHEVDNTLDSVLEGSRRISKLVNRLTNYSGRNDTQKEKWPLLLIVNDALHFMHHSVKRGIAVEVHISDDLEIYCDRQKISQVFINLIHNAVDALKDREGKICIRASSVDDDRVVIRIRDNGPGIPETVSHKIFDPFFTTKGKDEGTGLGLFIVRSIIEEHKGDISLFSVEGEGAEFVIDLPL